MKALSTTLIKRWKKLLDSGERREKTGEKSKGAEKEKSKGGEKESKVDKERKGEEEKGGKKVKGKLDARDSAREQSKDNFTGDEVRDRCFSSKKLKRFHMESCFVPGVFLQKAKKISPENLLPTRCRDLLLTAIWGEAMLVEGSL